MMVFDGFKNINGSWYRWVKHEILFSAFDGSDGSDSCDGFDSQSHLPFRWIKIHRPGGYKIHLYWHCTYSKLGVAKKLFIKHHLQVPSQKGPEELTQPDWCGMIEREADVPFSGDGLYYYSNALEYSATLELCSVDEKVKNTK